VSILRRLTAICREAVAAAWAQKVPSIVSIVIVAGMCVSVLLTTGRTVGAEDSVLASIDSAGTRSIVVRADPEAGLDPGVLDRLETLDGVEAAVAFGPATDTRNTAFDGGTPVPVRPVWGLKNSGLGLPPSADQDATPEGIGAGTRAWASARALDELGMLYAAGGITSGDGGDFAVVGEVSVPDYLGFLEPVVVAPQPPDGTGSVGVLLVIAERPALVAPVAGAVQSLLSVSDPDTVTISTSEDLAALRGLIEGQLGTFGRELVLIIFSISAVFVASILYGFTMLRRKDYGRRRALGASRLLIIGLILLQMLYLGTLGAALGSVTAATALVLTGAPVPGLDFIAAVAVLACAVAVSAAAVPAVIASRRDPIRELRVP
jgi:putative ABC transport system permease protein